MENNKNFISKKRKNSNHNNIRNNNHQKKDHINNTTCKQCKLKFYDKYTLLFHLAHVHQIYDNLCFRCFCIFILLDTNKKK